MMRKVHSLYQMKDTVLLFLLFTRDRRCHSFRRHALMMCLFLARARPHYSHFSLPRFHRLYSHASRDDDGDMIAKRQHDAGSSGILICLPPHMLSPTFFMTYSSLHLHIDFATIARRWALQDKTLFSTAILSKSTILQPRLQLTCRTCFISLHDN